VSGFQIALLVRAGFAWLMLMHSWSVWLEPRLEARRQAALARGEVPEKIKGLSNYAAADIGEKIHREAQAHVWERWVGRGIVIAIPVVTACLVIYPFVVKG